MRISATLLPLALALGTASAADCYSVGGCGTCESRGSMYGARNLLCGSHWWQTARFGHGVAVVSVTGDGFETQQRCYEGFDDIIESCHGTRNGGVYDWKSTHLDVDFCACGKAAGAVDFELEATANATLAVASKDE